MGNSIVLTACILLVAVSVSAQESSPAKVLNGFELVAGPSISANTGYLGDYKSITGYSVGAGYYQKIYKSFSLNLRSLYEGKGSVANYPKGMTDSNGTVTDINDQYTTKFNYWTFYLLPTIQLGKNRNIYVGTGGYYSLPQKVSVHTYTTLLGTGDFYSETTSTDKNYFNPNHDAGVTFQAGYAIKMGNRSQLMFQLFSNRGLVDLYNPEMGSQRNNTYGLLLSLRMQ